MQIPGFGEVGSTGMVGAAGLSLTPVAIAWKIALITLLISLFMVLARFIPRAEV
jgi:uncharacterized membrane protein